MGDVTSVTLRGDEPTALHLLTAVRAGDLRAVRELVTAHPGLAGARLVAADGGTRTPLHLVADWPGYFPNGPQMVHLLVDAGGDPDVTTTGRAPETALHWAASSDDVDVAATLIERGAALDTPGGSIGTPLANAVAYGCWHVARLLVGSGAVIGTLWEAAALGDFATVDAILNSEPPAKDDLDQAFWQACHGGQLRMAQHLLAAGADINANVGYADQSPAEIAGQVGTRRQLLVQVLRELSAKD